jgi:hypothetical protein
MGLVSRLCRRSRINYGAGGASVSYGALRDQGGAGIWDA